MSGAGLLLIALPALLGALLTLPGTLELLLLTLGASLPPTPAADAPGDAPEHAPGDGRIAVLVPAHDEAAGIAACVASLRACDDPAFDVLVVADNCTDATAALARAAGALVIERQDPAERGKGQALAFAFAQPLLADYAACIVVDADSRVSPNLVSTCRRLLAAGAAAVQCGYRIGNAAASTRARLLAIAWLAFNLLRPRGRARWGLSAGILGNGFALSRATLQAVPYQAHGLVEDLEYHLRLVHSGRRVWFAPAATVWADAPASGRAAAAQRARWEGGRLRLLIDWTPRLVQRLRAGQWRLAEPLLDLLLLPLGYQVLLLLLLLAVAVTVPMWLLRVYALAGLALIALHVLLAIHLGGGGWRELRALATAPLYLLWKLTLLGRIGRSARRDATWVRTERVATASAVEPSTAHARPTPPTDAAPR